MKIHLVRPELATSVLLNAKLGQSLDCLFAVAYMDANGVGLLDEVLQRRLALKHFRLRLVFRSRDLQTEPEALDRLLAGAKAAKGSLELHYSIHRKFHAKAYGFRRSRNPDAISTIVLGSANLTGAALDKNSGELGVVLDGNKIALEAWQVLEEFWDDAQEVTPRWLERYRAAYQKAEKKREEARSVERKWAATHRSNRPSFRRPDLSTTKFFVDHTEPASKELVKKAERAAKNSPQEVPEDYRIDNTKPHLPLNTNILQFHWPESYKKGPRNVRVVRLVKVVRVLDPDAKPGDKKRLWLVEFHAVRGTKLVLKQKDSAKNEKVLGKHRLDWQQLGEMHGRPRAKKARLIKALYALGFPKAT